MASPAPTIAADVEVGNNIAVAKNNHSQDAKQVSTATFFFFCLFCIEYYLHLSGRIPGLGILRPTLLLGATTFALLLSQRKIYLLRSPLAPQKWMKVLFFYVILSLPFVTFPGSVLRGNLAIFIKAILFFYFISEIIDSPKRLKIFIALYLACQCFRILEPLFLNITTGYMGSSTWLGEEGMAGRLSGAPHDVINPNDLGFVIVIAVTYLYFVVFPLGFVAKVISTTLALAFLYALILTMSRGGFIALLIVAWIIFRESNYKLVLILAGLGAVFAAWQVMTPVQKDRYLSLVDTDTQNSRTVDGRFSLMWHEIELGFKRPIFGHGIGTTPEAKFHDWGKKQASHILYGELLIELGMIGFYIFMRYIHAIFTIAQAQKLKLIAGQKIAENHMKMITALFWMYIVFSLSQWGLNVDHWYVLGGICVALCRILNQSQGHDLYAINRA